MIDELEHLEAEGEASVIQATPHRAWNGSSVPGRGDRAVGLRGAWRIAGLLFIGGSLSTVPSLFLLDRPFEPWVPALTVIAIISGLICLLLPWQRVEERWLAVVPVAATLQIAAAVAATDYVFTYLYFFVALFVGLVFARVRQMLPFLALIMVALVVPFAYESEPVRQTTLWVLAVAPGVMFIAIVVARLTANLEASKEAYRRLSTEDGLTGVGNYRSLIERLREETARHRRRGREFAVLTLDLDRFKEVNETQGHLVGDLLLAIVGSMLDLKVRAEDSVFRQGGDEFSVVAPETGRGQADLLARRIDEALARITSGDVRLSASVGTAVFPYDGNEPGELLDAADAALRAQKRPVGVEAAGATFRQPATAWRR
ncbi:MAG: diguanylate cyclase [Solirubrobacterales bacterium]